tara:strand:- start:20 stop:391 length:372 start_codon:yes stop_codon:yes gene_type:complete
MKNLPSAANVLIIDDSPAITRTARKFLEGTEFVVFSASTSIEGLSLIPDVSPNTILIDASMPDLDGYQFSDLLTNFRPDSGIKLVLLELKSHHLDIDKFNRGNFSDKLLKPFTREELLSILLA